MKKRTVYAQRDEKVEINPGDHLWFVDSDNRDHVGQIIDIPPADTIKSMDINLFLKPNEIDRRDEERRTVNLYRIRVKRHLPKNFFVVDGFYNIKEKLYFCKEFNNRVAMLGLVCGANNRKMCAETMLIEHLIKTGIYESFPRYQQYSKMRDQINSFVEFHRQAKKGVIDPMLSQSFEDSFLRQLGDLCLHSNIIMDFEHNQRLRKGRGKK